MSDAIWLTVRPTDCYYRKWILGTTVAVTDSADLEKRFAALDAALAKGISDADAGRVKPGDEVLDRLEAKYRAMAERTK
ncbi:hypothetical protein [Mesorhizobium sp. LNJC405B00]|uniref:hypothetical protein n=2 Tax=unclassified Mesorhizobium TaxID=325217 RepID=UPI0003CF5CF0|nr:hypothetical protein [Mesorhizobium sp. LNJC405B00]ESW77361.1 hypothetical protein X773_23985 [Mesorhizobium sp. LSJC285A00]